MRFTKSKVALLLALLSVMTFSGCTDWKKKHDALNVENQNTKGLLERERAEKAQMADQLSKDQQIIQDLQKQIVDKKRSPADATGFGEGYDVSFDANAGTITVTLPDAILFDPGKATLKNATSCSFSGETNCSKVGEVLLPAGLIRALRRTKLIRR